MGALINAGTIDWLSLPGAAREDLLHVALAANGDLVVTSREIILMKEMQVFVSEP